MRAPVELSVLRSPTCAWPAATALVAAAALVVAGCTAVPERTGAADLAGPAGRAGTVTRVVDGDTVEVTGPGGDLTVRVLGIDTPETPRDGPAQCFGPEATRFAADTLLDRPVTLVTDPTQDLRDRHGRLLAYLYLPDGSNYSVLAAGAGVARSYVYDIPVAEHAAIATAENGARAAGRGLWLACG